MLFIFSAEVMAQGASAQIPSNPDETHIRAEQMTGRPSRILNLDGKVKITRGTSSIDSATAEYHFIEDLVMASGDVRIHKNKDCYSGDILQYQMDTEEGYLSNPTYQLNINKARGHGHQLDFIGEDQYVIEQGTYTTCQATSPDWYLKTSRLDLDMGRDEGTAYGGTIYFKDVPILAAPWLSFPISGGRRSGFLPPEYFQSTTGGVDLTIPYYVDIAPNRDATIYPTFITKRGFMLGGEFRYLEPTYNGQFHGEVISKDHMTDTTRYSLSTVHSQALLPGLGIAWNYNRASDDQYAIDYGHSITESSQHLLPQNFSMTYGRPWGTVGVMTSNYQVLQDASGSIVKPYEIMPKVFAQFGGVDEFGGFDWSLNTEYANFLSDVSPSGKRTVMNGQISYPWSGTYYFVVPKVQYHLSEYQLRSSLLPGSSTSPRLSVPTFSVDSGLLFDRDAKIFNRDMTQTLEPRLLYVKTPYRNQADIPLFDTGISDLNYSQFFAENRFSGQDRVGDADQITAGLVSRIIEQDGVERLRLGAAQRYSFKQPLVVDIPNFFVNGVPHSTMASKSDFIFTANGKLTDTLNTNVLWQYDQSQQVTGMMSYGLRWQPAQMKVINAEYRYQDISQVNPEVMKQIDISVQWPLASRWYGVARTNYSVADKRVLDGLIGFEYKQDCWIFRAVAQRYQVPSTAANITSSANTSLFLQLELNGLSKIGTNPLEILRRSIPGYQPVSRTF